MKYSFDNMSEEDGELIGRIYGKMQEKYTKVYRGPVINYEDIECATKSAFQYIEGSRENYKESYDYTKDYDEHLIELAALCILAIKEEEGVRYQLKLDREGE